MQLTNQISIKSKFQGKSKFDFWSNIDVDDIVKLSVELKDPGYGRGLYATQITFHNLTRGTTFECSLTNATKYLNKIEYMEIVK